MSILFSNHLGEEGESALAALRKDSAFPALTGVWPRQAHSKDGIISGFRLYLPAWLVARALTADQLSYEVTGPEDEKIERWYINGVEVKETDPSSSV